MGSAASPPAASAKGPAAGTRPKELDGPTLRQAGAVSLPFLTVAPGPLGVAAVGPLPPAPAASGRAGQGEQRRFSGQALMWLRLFGS